MINKIVVRYIDGTVKKGTTSDFSPTKFVFHLIENDGGVIIEIDMNVLKAVYFVKDFDGNRDYKENYSIERVGFGKKIQVRFSDGETLVGYTQGFSPTRASFIVFPSDPSSNNEKVFVITASADKINFI